MPTSTVPTPTVLRLPRGWSAGPPQDGYAVAAPIARRPGDPIVFHRSTPASGTSANATAQALLDELTRRYADVVLIDAATVRARRGAQALRLLTTWREGDTGRTAEHRLVYGGDVLHVLAAVTSTARYAASAAAVRAVLDRFRPGPEGPATDVFAPAPAEAGLPRPEMLDAETFATEMLDVEVLRGRRPGAGVVRLDGGDALVTLPGLDRPRRVPRDLLPGWLASLVDLGPRPRPDVAGQLVTDRTNLDALLSTPSGADRAGRARLPRPDLSPSWAGALAALAESRAGHWRVGPLEVLDGGPAGLWTVGAVDECWLADELDGAPAPARPVLLRPSDATELWTALTRLICCPLPRAPGSVDGCPPPSSPSTSSTP